VLQLVLLLICFSEGCKFSSKREEEKKKKEKLGRKFKRKGREVRRRNALTGENAFEGAELRMKE